MTSALYAQTQGEAGQVTEVLGDGTIIFRVGTTEYRGLLPGHLDQLRLTAETLAVTKANNAALQDAVAALQRALAETDEEIAALVSASGRQAALIAEIEARTRRGKLDKILENQWFKLLAPLVPIAIAISK